MSNKVSELLDELRRLSRGKVESEQAEAIVEEVRAHLDASIQARLELGIPRGVAEQDAIQSFGSPKEFVRTAMSTREQPKQRLSLLAMWLSVSTLSLMLLPTNVASWNIAFLATAGVVVFGLLLAGWKSGRLRLRSLLKGYLYAVPIAAIGFAMTYSPVTSDLLGMQPLSELRELASSDRSAEFRAELGEFERLKRLAHQRIEAGIKPIEVPVMWHGDRVSYKQVPSAEAAKLLLAEIEKRITRQADDRIVLSKNYQAEAQRRLATPLAVRLMMMVPFAALSCSMFWLVCVLPFALGAIAKSIRVGTSFISGVRRVQA